MQKNKKLPENIKPEMVGDKRYVCISEGARRYSVSPHTFRMMAAEAHAIIHVRRIVLIDTNMIISTSLRHSCKRSHLKR